MSELRFALRSLRRSPSYTVFAVLTLSGAIGATAAMYAILYGILWRALPYEDPARIAMIWVAAPELGYPEDVTNFPRYEALRDGNSTFEAIAAYSFQVFHLAGEGEPERLIGANVSHNFFPLLAVEPAIGSYLSADASFVYPDRRIVLSDALWQRRFGADRSVVGRRIELDGDLFTVVGVMPESFRIPQYHDFWAPLALEEDVRTNRTMAWLSTIGRLEPGVSLDEARADLEVTATRFDAEDRPNDPPRGMVVNRLHEQWVRDVRSGLLLLGGAVVALWLLACANLAGMGLARTSARDAEIALRQTLGASRARVLWTLLGEGVVLGAIAAPFAWAIAAALAKTFVATAPAGPVGVPVPEMNARIYGIATALSMVSGALFSLAPGLYGATRELVIRIKASGGLHGSGASQRPRRLLVVSEIAIAFALLVGSLLLVRSFGAVRALPIGLEVEGLSRINLTLPRHYDTDASVTRLYGTVVERLASLPGIERISVVSNFLSGPGLSSSGFTVEGLQESETEEEAGLASVTPGYFGTAGIPLLRGRDFVSRDREVGPRVVIVNQTMAERYWPGQDPIGRRLSFGNDENDQPEWRTVVGVAGDVDELQLDRSIRPKTYFPLPQRPLRLMTVVFRSAVDPDTLFPSIKDAIWQIDDRLPVSSPQTVASVLDDRLASRRHTTFLVVVFAGAALFLAGVGVYGVLAVAVRQRLPEIGIRMAFGARPQDIAALMGRDGVATLLLGLVLGAFALVPLRGAMASLLFGVTFLDPFSLAVAVLLLTACSLLACSSPVLRASRTDPAVVMRGE